jgi:hypothetical protein
MGDDEGRADARLDPGRGAPVAWRVKPAPPELTPAAARALLRLVMAAAERKRAEADGHSRPGGPR